MSFINLLLPEIYQLGSTTVISIIAIFALFQIIRAKNGNENNKIIIEELEILKSNHIHSIDEKILGIRDRLKDLDSRNEKIIELLIEIKTILIRNGKH
jgi:hypothetical protein